MEQLVQLLGYFALCFAASCALAYAFTMAAGKRNRLTIPAGTILRLRHASGMYRSTMLESTKEGWTISAPIQRDSYVAIRPGESFIVEAADETGAFLFRTEVLSRDAETHRLTIKRPQKINRHERRERARSKRATPTPAVLEGQEAKVVDLSEVGARVATRIPLARGERVRLDIQGRPDPVFGWVLETLPGSLYGYDSNEVRLRFEDTLEHIKA